MRSEHNALRHLLATDAGDLVDVSKATEPEMTLRFRAELRWYARSPKRFGVARLYDALVKARVKGKRPDLEGLAAAAEVSLADAISHWACAVRCDASALYAAPDGAALLRELEAEIAAEQAQATADNNASDNDRSTP